MVNLGAAHLEGETGRAELFGLDYFTVSFGDSAMLSSVSS